MKSRILLLFAVVALLASCGKEESFSPIPEIKFDRFQNYIGTTGNDTAVDFIFTIRDGDGDIGLADNEFDNSCGALW